jgi:hypothetical protein
MKISLALGPRQPLSRQTAWGCLTTNLALPGFGSLMGGRVIGYPQVVLCVAGLILTLLFGIRFMLWSVKNWSRLHDPEADPVEALALMWSAGKWAFLGCAVFLFALLWALMTSLQIVGSARQLESKSVPPRLP